LRAQEDPIDTGDGDAPKVEEHLLDLYDHAPFGYVSTSTDWRILRTNATFAAFVGIEADALEGRMLLELLTAGSRIYHETHYSPLLKLQGRIEEVAADLRGADGDELPVLLCSVLHPGPVHSPAIIRTSIMAAPNRRRYEVEMQRARRRAEASEQRVALLHRVVAALAAAVDVDDVAAAAHTTLGREGDEESGLSTTPTDAESTDGPVARVWRGDGPRVYPERGLLVLPLGPAQAPTAVLSIDLLRLIPDPSAAVSLDSIDDATRDLLTTITDEVDRALQRARLYERKDWLLGVAAHDLRTPLTVIQGNARVVQRVLEGPLHDESLHQTARTMLDRIVTVTAEMAALIDDVLDMSAIESGNLRLIVAAADPIELVRTSVRDHEAAAAAKSITFDLDLPGDIAPAPLDQRRIRQVLDNLVGNAIKYSENGTVVLVRLLQHANAVEVIVRDQGQGIPADELPQVFQPFRGTSAKPTAGERSTGLGLSIAHAIVQAHGGNIVAESILGEGSTFRFTLPSGPNRPAT
jgi:PAS domain S-box-containing protein